MKKPGFLADLKKEGRLELVEPSETISSSYLGKADNSLKSSKILLQNNLYENSISSAYYAMYDSLAALLFRTGIKCENHSAAVLLLKLLFGRDDLFKTISFAKNKRIDSDYYITSKDNLVLTKSSAETLIKKAEEFIIQIRLLISKLNTEDIEQVRKKFDSLF